MTSQQFLAWMEHSGCNNAVAVGEALGLARETARKMVAEAKAGKDVPIKRSVALAMTALANGLRPWDEYQR